MISRLETSICSPAAVRWIFFPSCSNSGRPAWSSSLLTCVDTAGCVRCSSAAAREKLRWRATASNTFSWRRVACFMVRLCIRDYEWICQKALTIPNHCYPLRWIGQLTIFQQEEHSMNAMSFLETDTSGLGEAQRQAYNAAFYELGLRWHWDSSDYDCQMCVESQRAHLRRYVETSHPHML